MIKPTPFSDEKVEALELEYLVSPTSTLVGTEGAFDSGHNGNGSARDAFQDSLRGERNSLKTKSTPIPWTQCILWSLWRATHPLFFGVIMPFINHMLVDDLKVSDEAHVGHYSGTVETAAAIGHCIGVFFWSWLSDKYGRKKVALVGISFSCLACASFGFGRSFVVLVMLRFLMGLANSAQSATVKVMIAEGSDTTNNAKLFAYVGLGWQMGSTLAPMIGAFTANPAQSWPTVFGGTIFERYPYAAPGIAVAFLPFFSVLAGIFLLEETHPDFRNGRRPPLKAKLSDYTPIRRSSDPFDAAPEDTDDDDEATLHEFDVRSPDTALKSPKVGSKMSPRQPGLFSTGLGFIMILWFLIIFQVLALSAAEVLLFFSSQAIGGLGLTPQQMSLFMGLRPLILCAYEFHMFPKMSKRWGSESVLRFLICFPPLIHLIYLLLSTAASAGAASPGLIVFMLSLSLLVQVFQNPVFLSADVIIPSRAPTSAQLSSANAISELVAQVGAGFGTICGSSLFAASVTLADEYAAWRGKIVWLVLFGVTGATAMLSQWLTKIESWMEREGKSVRNEGRE